MAKATTKPRSVLHADGRPKFDKRHLKSYDPDKDPCLVGFQIGSSHYGMATRVGKEKPSELDAYDFYSDSVTGVRPGETNPPYGTVVVSLRTQVGHYDTLPPVAAWQQGMWLWDAVFETGFKFEELPVNMREELTKALKEAGNGQVPAEFFSHYIVTGEGTPTNSIYRVYILPREMGSENRPKHPMMWPDKLKSSSYGSVASFGGGYGRLVTPHAEEKPNAVQLPPPPKKVHLPASMRTRCGGCGHWWAIDDLIKHANVCPGVKGQGDSDMAMMCDSRCGCETLDDVAVCKPGFPRPKPEPTVVEPTLAEDLQDSVTSNGGQAAGSAAKSPPLTSIKSVTT